MLHWCEHKSFSSNLNKKRSCRYTIADRIYRGLYCLTVMWQYRLRTNWRLLLNIASPAVFEILGSKRRLLGSLVWPFGVTWRHRSRDHLIPRRLFPNGFRDIQRQMQRNSWHDLDTTFKQRSGHSFLVPIDISYTTSYRLSILTFALGGTV